jgi:hypothetical protein
MPFSQTFNLLKSDKNDHFTGSMATSEYEDENLSIPNALSKIWLDYVSIRAYEALNLEIEFYSSASFSNYSDLDRDYFLFSKSLSMQSVPSSTAVFTSSTSIQQPYIDEDAAEQLHVRIRNRGSGAATKSASSGATGYLVVKFGYREQV